MKAGGLHTCRCMRAHTHVHVHTHTHTEACDPQTQEARYLLFRVDGWKILRSKKSMGQKLGNEIDIALL